MMIVRGFDARGRPRVTYIGSFSLQSLLVAFTLGVWCGIAIATFCL